MFAEEVRECRLPVRRVKGGGPNAMVLDQR